MNTNRITNFALILLTIILGLLSRKVDFLPLALGDTLYAVMVYWGFRFILTNKPQYYSFVLSILFCFGIELLQLVNHPILIEWRNHAILRLIFGQGFLWSDLIAYFFGAILAFLIDRKIVSFILKQK